MSAKAKFAQSALARAAQGQIGARRGDAAEDQGGIAPPDSATRQSEETVLQRDAMQQRYDLPLPKPRVKKQKPAHTSVYLPPDLLEWVKGYCFEHDLSMNAIVVEYLEELRRRMA
jgi:hypothetical protein